MPCDFHLCIEPALFLQDCRFTIPQTFIHEKKALSINYHIFKLQTCVNYLHSKLALWWVTWPTLRTYSKIIYPPDTWQNSWTLSVTESVSLLKACSLSSLCTSSTFPSESYLSLMHLESQWAYNLLHGVGWIEVSIFYLGDLLGLHTVIPLSWPIKQLGQ